MIPQLFEILDISEREEFVSKRACEESKSLQSWTCRTAFRDYCRVWIFCSPTTQCSFLVASAPYLLCTQYISCYLLSKQRFASNSIQWEASSKHLRTWIQNRDKFLWNSKNNRHPRTCLFELHNLSSGDYLSIKTLFLKNCLKLKILEIDNWLRLQKNLWLNLWTDPSI